MSNLNTNTTDSVARFVKAVGDPQRYGFSLVRRWEDFHAAYVDSRMITQNATKRYTDPKADKQPYSGTFIQSSMTPEVTGEDTIDLVQTLVKVRTNAVDSNAQLVRQEGDPLHAGYRLTRDWPYVDPNSADTIFTGKWAVTSYSNPKADNQSYTGTFAHTALDPIKSEDRTVTLRQVLTKTKSTTDSSDADLSLITGEPPIAGAKIVRAWHYIDPTSVDDRFAALNAITSYPTGIKASGQLYSGKYMVSDVKSIETEDRTYRIEQTNTKVMVVTSDTSLINPLVERRKNLIHPFGEGTGTSYGIIFRYRNLDPATDTKCIAIADTTLEAKMGSGYNLIDRKTTEEDNGTMTFWLLSEKKTRIDWSSAIRAAPDHVQRDNADRDGEVKTEIWFGINNDCDAVVRSQLNNDTYVDTGFEILRVTQADNDDGSDDWTRTSIKRLNDTRTDSEHIAAHSIEHSAIQAKHSEYRNYRPALLPADPSITASYKFVSKRINMRPDGLVDKEFVQEKSVASNTMASGRPSRKEIVGHTNPQTDTLYGNVVEELYDRVSLTGVDTALTNLKTQAGSVDTYVVPTISYRDIGHGAARIDRRMKKINAGGKYYVSEVNLGIGYGNKSAMRVWPNVMDTKAAVLMTGDAQTAFTWNTVTYPAQGATRRRHEDGTSDVVQIGSFAKSGFDIASTTDSYLSVDYVVSKDKSHLRRTTWIKKHATISAAKTFIETGVLGNDSQEPFGRLEGRVRASGDGNYVAYKVKFSAPL